jgi:hypothetical protein
VDAGHSTATGLEALLGNLNFSTGRADARAQAKLFEAWQIGASGDSPWLAVADMLLEALAELHRARRSAFLDIQQAQAVIDLAFRQLPPVYRAHHRDLLAHQSDAGLFQCGFFVRAAEAVLVQQGPWNETDRILAGAMNRLNDFIGYRPIAILETRPQGEPYDHEKLCPIPLYLQGVGAAPGLYPGLIGAAITALAGAPTELHGLAHFDLGRLDELALDPRAYDNHHPADRRPNYRFGEWDPHHIDGRGFYRRLVVRQMILDALLTRVREGGEVALEELVREAGTVLGGAILMASGISGAGPDTHDSTVNLAHLMPKIARGRDAYYAYHLDKLPASHRQRLQREAESTRQPFGGARQHLNQELSRQRAGQLEQRQVALLFAELGYATAARRHAAKAPSQRLLTDIHLELTTCQFLSQRGQHSHSATRLEAAEETLHRAIACGAAVDPWNILGFQGLFPIFNGPEDSVRDGRVLELIQVVDRLLTLYAELRGEAAAGNDAPLGIRLATRMQRLAAWWDRFASTTVNDVPHVIGRERLASAEQVVEALSQWRQQGEGIADTAFWRQHLDQFRSTKCFAVVVETLLEKHDYRASMALLMNWLSQAEQIPLQDGEHSFHTLALRWMLAVGQEPDAKSPSQRELIRKFIDYLEANADAFWTNPRFERLEGADDVESIGEPREVSEVEDEEDALFGAAYEGVTFKDSADDGNEGELLGFEPRQEFDLEAESQALENRLRFLSTAARLFHLAARNLVRGPAAVVDDPALREALEGWLARASRNYQDLLALLDAVHKWPIPAPSGSHDSLVEFDRRQNVKQYLLTAGIGTCLETAFAVAGLRCTLDRDTAGTKGPRWEPAFLDLEKAMWNGDPASARSALPRFLEHFQHEPLLFAPLAHGGNPRLVLRAGIAQTVLRALIANLPRLALLRETHGVLRVALTMEHEQKLDGPRITQFDQLFEIGLLSTVEAVLASAAAVAPPNADELVALLEQLVEPFASLWADHCGRLRQSVLEVFETEEAWAKLRGFIQTYGGTLFHARFMTLGNLRGILNRGIGAYLRFLEDNPDPQNPVKLVEDIDRVIPRAEAEILLGSTLQAIIENYEEYRDYNTTTAQSDYGENLHTLLDFLRLKAEYEREALQLRPRMIVHKVLVKQQTEAASAWQRRIEERTAASAELFLQRLADLEKRHGMRLRNIADRIAERFVKPLTLDRVCALIGPAFDEARVGGEGPVLEKLERALDPYLETPTGSGLDVPPWLRRLDAELHIVKNSRTAMANLAENLFQVPRIVAVLEEVREMLRQWA